MMAPTTSLETFRILQATFFLSPSCTSPLPQPDFQTGLVVEPAILHFPCAVAWIGKLDLEVRSKRLAVSSVEPAFFKGT